jgi:3-deoxy-D-manno-octulosonic-acid transferase
VASPFVRLYVKRRIKSGKESETRFHERFGIPSKPRPNGPLVWVHAVSVGEVVSAIPFIQELKNINNNINILLTTTTLASAKIVEERLKNLVMHQYTPFDVFTWIKKFIKYWNPKIVFFIESELWPNILYYLYENGIPIYLINARISNKSLERFYLAKKWLNISLFNVFRTIYVSSEEMRQKISNFGTRDIVIAPSLKVVSTKLPVDNGRATRLIHKINGRKVWMAVSTHPSEEEIILQIHNELEKTFPDVLTIIAMRHPARATEVASICTSFKLSHRVHTTSFILKDKIIEEIYILDKIGCLGDFFEIIDTVLVCGSLVPNIGGHNFLEPLRFHCNVATGQHIENFTGLYQQVKTICAMLKNNEEIIEFVSSSFKGFSRDSSRLDDVTSTGIWINIARELARKVAD